MDTQTPSRQNTDRTLSGRRILITRSRHQAPELSELIRNRGGIPVEFPVIRIAAPDSWEPVDRAIHRLNEYDWIVFTSQNGVLRFFKRMSEVLPKTGPETFPNIAAIGPATAETVRKQGYEVSLQPDEFRAEKLAGILTSEITPPGSVLLARSNIARPVLQQRLREQNVAVDEVHPYHLKRDDRHDKELLDTLKNKPIDLLTFASSQTVRNFVELLQKYELDALKNVPAACIGPITAGTARENDLDVVAVPDDYTIPSLFEEITKYFGETTS